MSTVDRTLDAAFSGKPEKRPRPAGLNRAERRQIRLGRAPLVVALPTPNEAPRIRKATACTKRQLARITIDSGDPNNPQDSRLVVGLMQKYFQRTGQMPLVVDPSSPMLMARNILTQEPVGFCSLKPIPGPAGTMKLYVENFHVVEGEIGKAAARAILERLLEITPHKVCLVESQNLTMLRVLEHYGMRVVGYVLEGPFDFAGACEATVAAEPSEATG